MNTRGLTSPLLSKTLPSIQEATLERSNGGAPQTPTTPQPMSLPDNPSSPTHPNGEGRAKKKMRVTWGGHTVAKTPKKTNRRTHQTHPSRLQTRPSRLQTHPGTLQSHSGMLHTHSSHSSIGGSKEEITEDSLYPQSLMSYNIMEDGYGLQDNLSTGYVEQEKEEEEKEEEGEEYEHSFMSSGEGVIDGRVDVRTFVSVEQPYGNGDMSTSKELNDCKKSVLKPFMIFLKVIGWWRWRGDRQELQTPLYVKLLNIVYPSLLFLLLMLACCTQSITCFFRDEASYDRNEHNITLVHCSSNIVTRSVILDLILTLVYLGGLYIFRFGEPEHISSLMQTVYLSFNFKHRISPQKKITFLLRAYLLLAVVWVALSIFGSVLRVFSLELLGKQTFIKWITFQDIHQLDGNSGHTPSEHFLRFSFVIYSILGFVLFDLVYVTVVTTYLSEVELLLTYIYSVRDKVQSRSYPLGEAIKEIGKIYDFLTVLNGKLATLTTLCLFIFISSTITSLVGLTEVDEDGDDLKLEIAVGLINLIQWTALSLAPLIQAARLTSHCKKLRRLGLEVGVRPFSYLTTPQLVLDSFLQYTTATKYTAKLAAVPIYPSFVVGLIFALGILLVWVTGRYHLLQFAPWF